MIDARIGVAALVGSGEGAHVRAGIRGPRRRLAKTPSVLALAHVIADLAVAPRHALVAERLERRALGRGEIALEDIHGRPDVRVGVEDTEAVSRHCVVPPL